MDTVLRWAVQTSSWQPTPEEWDFFLKLIPPNDQRQVVRFIKEDDQKRHLLSQLLQRKCISVALGVPWSQVRISRTRGGRPWLECDGIDKDHAPNFNFNISHDGDFIALATEPLCICGVDVAAIQRYRGPKRKSIGELLDIYADQLTSEEKQSIEAAGNSAEAKENAFCRIWSLKEAFVKARGDGLSFNLERANFKVGLRDADWEADFTLDGRPHPKWRFHLQELAAGHWVSVSRGPPEDIVDAWGGFTESLEASKLSDTQMQMALTSPTPPFTILQPADLIPEKKLAAYQAMVERSSS